MNAIPVLETERLILREHRASDFPAFAAFLAEPEVARFTSRKLLSEEEAWKKLLAHRGMWAISGFGYFAIEDKASGAFLGNAGVQDAKRDLQPSLDGTLEAGWGFSASAQGKGYAREAMRAVLDWCDETHPEMAQSCIIDHEHIRSIRLAQHLGFRETARTAYKERPTIIFERAG